MLIQWICAYYQEGQSCMRIAYISQPQPLSHCAHHTTTKNMRNHSSYSESRMSPSLSLSPSSKKAISPYQSPKYCHLQHKGRSAQQRANTILERWWNSRPQSKSSCEGLIVSLERIKLDREKVVSAFIWQKFNSYELLEYEQGRQNVLKRKLLASVKVLKDSNVISKVRFQAIRERFQRKGLKDYLLDLLIHVALKDSPLTKKNLPSLWEKYVGVDLYIAWEYILSLKTIDQVIFSAIQTMRPLLIEAGSLGQRALGLYSCWEERFEGSLDAFSYILEEMVRKNSISSCPRKVAGVYSQLHFIEGLLLQAQEDLATMYHPEQQSFALIGSYLNQLNLQYGSRIDILVNFKDRDRRVSSMEILRELSNSITKRAYGADDKPKVDLGFEIQTGIVPFLKIRYKNWNVIKDRQYYATGFHLYVNEANSLQSSRIIGLYTTKPWIRKLCVLAKLWARRKYIDSSIDKSINGYIITIMTLYYLIQTNQASPITQDTFLLQEDEEQGQHPPLSLYDNFKGWLNFYISLKQSFFEINLVNGDRKVYSPCRLRIRLSGEFYKAMQSGLESLCKYEFEELFKYPKGEK